MATDLDTGLTTVRVKFGAEKLMREGMCARAGRTGWPIGSKIWQGGHGRRLDDDGCLFLVSVSCHTRSGFMMIVCLIGSYVDLTNLAILAEYGRDGVIIVVDFK